MIAIEALLSLLVGATGLNSGAPGCIAAITQIPMGAVLSGQTVTFTDGTIISPTTHFISRTRNFGDGHVVTSSQPNASTLTHVYVNSTGRTMTVTVRLSERTGADACSQSTNVEVSPISIAPAPLTGTPSPRP